MSYDPHEIKRASAVKARQGVVMNWFPFFKSGKHIASSGAEFDATSEKLDKILEMNKGREIPIAIGHPKESSPAWGWIGELRRAGDALQAKPKQLVSEFEAMVRKGLFKNVSVSLNPDLTIRHIGFLGAAPPAIEGLQAEFAADDAAVVLEFSEFTNPEGGNDMAKTIQELEAELAAEKAKTAEFSKAAEKVATLEADLAAERRKTRTQEFSAFLGSEPMSKKVSPAMKQELLAIMEFAAGTESYEFSAPDPADAAKTVKVTKAPVELVKEFAAKYLPELLTEEEIAKKAKAAGDKPAPHEFMGKVAEFAAANKISEGKAVIAIARDFPELHQEWLASIKK